uniref:putative lysine-specific demethylase JMJ16 isoform X5 n=1 Tax=Erigeron canadensis TaxID=72917 RepID=UPI001CB9515B|nr:putative lysine-specific demethylase JMJ16 isoform X5 [Erigeron canadensis]
MTSDGRVSSRKTDDEVRSPPGFVSVRPFTLKWTKKDHEPYNLVEPIEAASKIVDFEKLQKSVKQRPWVLKTQPINLKKGDSKHLKTNNSVENTLPKGVILGGSGCQKVIARWRPEDACRPVVEYTPVFQPEEVEFEDIFKYIAKIRPKAEEYGICRIIPPKSWKPPCLLRGTKFESSRFSTHVQSIDALKDLHSKRKLNEIVEQTDGNRRIRAKIENGSDNFEFKRGPEFTLRTFRAYAEHFKQNYFQKKDIFTDFRTPPWENIEGEYWRIVQHPTEEIQVLCGHNLEADLPSLVDDGQSEYTKSCWYLHNTPKLPGSLLSFDSDNTAVLSPRMDVGMCFSSICWKVEEHQLYSLSYMHFGASRIWYGVPSKYHLKCEALLKKSFPELAGHPELFHKLVLVFIEQSRTRQESFRREFLCNASQSRKMEEDFGCTVKRECIICFYDLYFSAASCPCSPDKYSCLEHSKQICACPWSSRFFLFRYDIDELNRLIDTIEGELDPKS